KQTGTQASYFVTGPSGLLEVEYHPAHNRWTHYLRFGSEVVGIFQLKRRLTHQEFSEIIIFLTISIVGF
ncbi:hypothetical protein CO612_00965, partial [Lysobacteraceae bacterium NML71-0210]